jgi:hypothetical protein
LVTMTIPYPFINACDTDSCVTVGNFTWNEVCKSFVRLEVCTSTRSPVNCHHPSFWQTVGNIRTFCWSVRERPSDYGLKDTVSTPAGDNAIAGRIIRASSTTRRIPSDPKVARL